MFVSLYLLTLAVNNVGAMSSKCVYVEYQGRVLNTTEIGCPQHNICKKHFKISYINILPYQGIPIDRILKKCCGVCARYTDMAYFDDISKITPTAMAASDFLLPFLGSSNAKTLHGFHFIPLVRAPNLFYITVKLPPFLVRLSTGCLELFPIIVMCLLMSVMSGFVAWIIETWLNQEEFPRSFLTGWFEGFWWSFISMTTVGYGDKTPKSIAARIFCVFWVLIGVGTFGMLTATLTGELMKAHSPPEPTMKGANVGVLRYREYDMYMVARQGGIAVESEGGDFFYDLFGLISKLQSKEIDGVVMDKYTLSFTEAALAKIIHQVQDERTLIEFFLEGTLRHEKVIGAESFSYGMLVREEEVYEFLRDVSQDNRIYFETKLALKLNRIERPEEDTRVFSPNDLYFIQSLKVIMGVLGCFCIFGFMYEVKRNNLRLNDVVGWVRLPKCCGTKNADDVVQL